MIAVETLERPASEADEPAALEAIDRDGGVWLGCDVSAPGVFRCEARAALDPLLSFFLDGHRLRVLPHGDTGRALAVRLTALADFEPVQGRLERELPCRGRGPAPGAWPRCAPCWPSSTSARRASASTARWLSTTTASHLAKPCPTTAGAAWCWCCRSACCGPTRRAAAGWSSASPRWLPRPGAQAAIEPVQLQRFDDDLPRGGHAAAVARGVELMRRGELCSLVLSQTFRRQVQVDAAAAFARLRRDNPYPAMFFAHLGGGERVFGASPDVQVRADGEWVETAPVCGTFRRGADPVDDHEQAKALVNSEVDEASLALCADSDRNDKARVCEPGSVQLLARRRVHFFSTIIHTIDHTRGRRRADVDGFDIVLAHATPATVTGMPKPDARRAIDALEAGARGWYAGAAVRIGSDGSCEALTMLRFARLAGDWAEVRTGGSLLADSDPPREEEETRLKAESMFRVLAGQSPRVPVAAAAAGRRRGACASMDGGDALAALAREALVQAGCSFADDAAIPCSATRRCVAGASAVPRSTARRWR